MASPETVLMTTRTDKAVPAGVTEIDVVDDSIFSVGDEIIIGSKDSAVVVGFGSIIINRPTSCIFPAGTEIAIVRKAGGPGWQLPPREDIRPSSPASFPQDASCSPVLSQELASTSVREVESASADDMEFVSRAYYQRNIAPACPLHAWGLLYGCFTVVANAGQNAPSSQEPTSKCLPVIASPMYRQQYINPACPAETWLLIHGRFARRDHLGEAVTEELASSSTLPAGASQFSYPLVGTRAYYELKVAPACPISWWLLIHSRFAGSSQVAVLDPQAPALVSCHFPVIASHTYYQQHLGPRCHADAWSKLYGRFLKAYHETHDVVLEQFALPSSPLATTIPHALPADLRTHTTETRGASAGSLAYYQQHVVPACPAPLWLRLYSLFLAAPVIACVNSPSPASRDQEHFGPALPQNVLARLHLQFIRATAVNFSEERRASPACVPQRGEDLCSQAEHALEAASADGRLAKALAKGNHFSCGDPELGIVPGSQEESDHAILRADARRVLLQASAEGRLSQAFPPKAETRACEIQDLRSSCRQLLAGAYAEGRLDEALAEGQASISATRPFPSSAEVMWARAGQALLDASADGRLASALARRMDVSIATDDRQLGSRTVAVDGETFLGWREHVADVLVNASRSGSLDSALVAAGLTRVPGVTASQHAPRDFAAPPAIGSSDDAVVTPSDSAEQLREIVSLSLENASRDGRLESAVRECSESRADDDILVLRAIAERTLLNASRDGKLSAALQETNSCRHARGNEQPADDVQAVRTAASRTLMDATLDGRLTQALQSTKGRPFRGAGALVVSAGIALEDASGDGRLEEALWKVAHGSDAKVSCALARQSPEVPGNDVDPSHVSAGKALEEACCNGMLEKALRQRRDSMRDGGATHASDTRSVERVTDAEMLRALATKTLIDGSRDGRLTQVLKTKGRPVGDGKDLKVMACQTLVDGSRNGNLAQALRKTSRESGSHLVLSASECNALEAGDRDGKLQAVLQDTSTGTLAHDMHPTRNLIRQSMIDAALDGRLSQALQRASEDGSVAEADVQTRPVGSARRENDSYSQSILAVCGSDGFKEVPPLGNFGLRPSVGTWLHHPRTHHPVLASPLVRKSTAKLNTDSQKKGVLSRSRRQNLTISKAVVETAVPLTGFALMPSTGTWLQRRLVKIADAQSRACETIVEERLPPPRSEQTWPASGSLSESVAAVGEMNQGGLLEVRVQAGKALEEACKDGRLMRSLSRCKARANINWALSDLRESARVEVDAVRRQVRREVSDVRDQAQREISDLVEQSTIVKRDISELHTQVKEEIGELRDNARMAQKDINDLRDQAKIIKELLGGFVG
eukprot:TRINITY_DN41956_c0_g1_i2.p1 TRINITY_DN41956_c0_g1~~TRINITY_DN41956_c0_g1_i2.p1  ORF type:complete len:1356 (+),score=170.71 TRINITY_DN41956_c0_g1_i2:50-4069(+)